MATATLLPLITDARRARWGEMVRDRNPLMVRNFQAANGPVGSVYGDHGQWCALAYQITGDPNYAAKSWARLRGYLAKNPGDPNQVKEIGWEMPVLVAMLRDRLSEAEIAEAYAGLARWCSWVATYNPWIPNKGWRYNDSDQTTGQYMMFRLTDLVTGSSFAQLPQAIGGREAIRSYVAKSQGGLWIEGPDYNADTLPILILGREAINTLSGVEEFPEVADLLVQLADWTEFDLSEDLRWTPPWSDTQNKGGPWWYHYYPYLTILAGLTNHPKVKRIVERAQAQVSDSDKWSGWWLCLYVPEGCPPYPKPASEKPWRFAPRVGILRYDTPTTLFHAHINPGISVDHEVYHTRDIEMWADGEVVLPRPAGYAGPTVDNTGCNSIILAGLSRSPIGGPRTVKEAGGADWCGLAATMAGPHFPANYWDNPPNYLRASPTSTPQPLVSSVVFIDGPTRIVVTRDRVRITDPRQLPKVNRYTELDGGYAGREIAAMRALVQWNVHSPVQPTVTGNARIDWRTVKNDAPVSVRFFSPTATIKGIDVLDESVQWPPTTAGMDADQKRWQSRVLCDANDFTMFSVWAVGPEVAASLNADGSVSVGNRVASFADDGTPQVN